jgi:hypothetical protein
MKVIKGTSSVLMSVFIIFFLSFIYFIGIQFVYSQTVENDIIENTLETVEEATKGISEITNSLNNASELIERSTQNTTAVAVNDTDSSIGQEKEHLKPLSDEMLEYAEEIFPALSNATLSREDKVKILNQQFTDPKLFLQNWKSLKDSIDSMDDPIKRESLFSNTIKRNNTSDEFQTIEKGHQQQESDSLIQQSSNIYEGLGIKLKYFDPWTIFLQFDEPTCHQINLCYIQLSTPITNGLENYAMISITQNKFDSPKITDECKCDTLQNYVRYQYENHLSTADNFSFINDNQTTISNDNKPAIQLEYDLSLDKNDNKGFDIFTKNDQSFYHFSLVVNKNSQYSKHIDDFKKMINSIEFVSSNDSKKKQPSFMTSTEPEKQTQPSFMTSEESNKSISSISNNENEMNFSDLEIPKQLDINQKSNELTILSHDSYINSIGHMHIIGEIENNTPNIKQFVQVIATFYDSNNKVVGTSNTYTTPTDLKPDEVAPFDLILTEASIPVEQIERYTLKVSGQ